MKAMIVHADAEAELNVAASYYEERRDGLGKEFREEIEIAFAQILEAPARFASYGKKGTRQFPLRRFPYVVYYRELADTIWIAAVAHQKRRPGYWRRRKPPM